MANTVSVEQAAEDALSVWLASQLIDVKIWDEWPDAAIALPTSGAVTVLRAGSLIEDLVPSPEVLKRVDEADPSVLSTYTYRIAACEQPLQLDVWATSKPRRDDIIQRLGDALTAGKRATLGTQYFIDHPDVWTNQDIVEAAISLQLAAPWDHLIAQYDFAAPVTEDSPESSKRREFRATYAGSAYFDRTVDKTVARLKQITLRAAIGNPPVPVGTRPTMVVTPSGTTRTRT